MHPYSEIYFMEYYIGETAKFGVVSHILAIKFNDSSTTKYILAPRYNNLPLLERSDALIQILKQMKSQNNFFVRMKY